MLTEIDLNQQVKDTALDLLATAEDTLRMLKEQETDLFHQMTPDNDDVNQLIHLCRELRLWDGLPPYTRGEEDALRDQVICTPNGLLRSIGDRVLSLCDLERLATLKTLGVEKDLQPAF